MKPPLQQPTFSCVFPAVTKTCAWLKIYTISDLWQRVETAGKAAIAEGLWTQTKGVSEQNLERMLAGRRKDLSHHFVNPWNGGRKVFHPLAIFTGLALGRFPTFLFGSPETLEMLNRKLYEIPTPQSIHIRAFMREAHNPLTGRKGISRAEFVRLSYLKTLDTHFAQCLNAESTGSSYGVAFVRASGAATEWGITCSAILDKTVEETFPFSVARLENSSGRFLPMNQPLSLDAVENIEDQSAAANPEYAMQMSDIRRVLDEAQSNETLVGENGHFDPLTKDEKRVLLLRYTEEHTLEEIGVQLGCTRSGAAIIESKALKKIEKRLTRAMGAKIGTLLPM